MSIVRTVSALAVLALTALSFAACGGNVSANSGPCATYCQLGLDCLMPPTCTLADPAAAQDACVSACESGFAKLAPSDAAALTACITCAGQAAAGKCILDVQSSACDAECKAPGVDAAGETVSKAIEAVPPSPAAECTNGMGAFGGSCTGGGDGTSCTTACCNGKSCTTSDVAVQCTGAAMDMCTCTAGKNKGKTFQSADGCESDIWTICNQ